MAKIKHTKNEMKAQRDALRRYERYLPMLLLKKQQLQAELAAVDARREELAADERRRRDDLEGWVRLFAEPEDWSARVRVSALSRGEANVAGVPVPTFEAMSFERAPADLFATPSWHDEALDALEHLARLEVEGTILAEQRRRIGEELRVTSQRVNLFEKIKIPECRENIRVIRIFLGDQQTAGVARAKTAKSRTAAFAEFGPTLPAGAPEGDAMAEPPPTGA